jgi:hypothetical protein
MVANRADGRERTSAPGPTAVPRGLVETTEGPHDETYEVSLRGELLDRVASMKRAQRSSRGS